MKSLQTVVTVWGVLHAWGGVHGADVRRLSFVNDVLPQLTKAGCNMGTCHSKPDGQNNFKLSVFAYDPRHDYNEIVKDDRGRRLLMASPENSLLLKKASGEMPHEGGARLEVGSEGYQVVLDWIRAGVPFGEPNEPRLTSISVEPREKIYAKSSTQKLKVTARFSDGSERDVTRLTNYSSNDKETASVDDSGLVTAGSVSGEGVVVTTFMGMVDVTRVTIPADKKLGDHLYARLPVNNEIDNLVYARLKKLGIAPSATCTDEEFLRRASLDSIGVLPSADRAEKFLSDNRPDKRERLIDELLEHPNYADHWAVRWGDLIRPNPSRVGVKPVLLLDAWLRDAFRRNMPYDAMVRELLTAQGSTHESGPTALFRDKREPADASAFVSQIFLGVRMDCARCHHHPSEKWTQEDYYQLAAFFGQMKRKGQGISAPISGEPEFVWYAPGSKGVEHPVTEAIMSPRPPDGSEMPYVDGQDPRRGLADWMASSENPFFAKAITNRIWGEFLGRGIVDPVDDFRASNPPSNEELIDWLARDFISHGFDLKHLMRTIMRSNVYQLSSIANEHNTADNKNYSRSLRRRLTAEVLLDALCDLTGVKEDFGGLPKGARAVQTWNHKIDSDFLDAFGRPNASQECPCERDRKPSVVQALHLMNSNSLQSKLESENGWAMKLANSGESEPQIVRHLYLATYTRLPSAEEMRTSLRFFNSAGSTRSTAIQDLLWALVNSAEFVFNH
jgi:hypothetical protein